MSLLSTIPSIDIPEQTDEPITELDVIKMSVDRVLYFQPYVTEKGTKKQRFFVKVPGKGTRTKMVKLTQESTKYFSIAGNMVKYFDKIEQLAKPSDSKEFEYAPLFKNTLDEYDDRDQVNTYKNMAEYLLKYNKDGKLIRDNKGYPIPRGIANADMKKYAKEHNIPIENVYRLIGYLDRMGFEGLHKMKADRQLDSKSEFGDLYDTAVHIGNENYVHPSSGKRAKGVYETVTTSGDYLRLFRLFELDAFYNNIGGRKNKYAYVDCYVALLAIFKLNDKKKFFTKKTVDRLDIKRVVLEAKIRKAKLKDMDLEAEVLKFIEKIPQVSNQEVETKISKIQTELKTLRENAKAKGDTATQEKIANVAASAVVQTPAPSPSVSNVPSPAGIYDV